MSVSWTQARSRVAVAARRLMVEGSTPENERELADARADFVASRLVLALEGVIASRVALGADHRTKLVALIEKASSVDDDVQPGPAS